MNLQTAATLLLAVAPVTAHAGGWVVDPEAGNNALSAVFDAALGERITAVSSSIGCELTYDEGSGAVAGRCSVPITAIRVDNDDTKSDHFRQWATNKKSDPANCRIEAVLSGLKVGPLSPGVAAPFTADVPFTVCGRPRADGGRERLQGTALLFPAGAYGERPTIRIRATVAGFDREAYRIGPGFTDGWLARVQSLAKVVATTGTIELSLFAKAR